MATTKRKYPRAQQVPLLKPPKLVYDVVIPIRGDLTVTVKAEGAHSAATAVETAKEKVRKELETLNQKMALPGDISAYFYRGSGYHVTFRRDEQPSDFYCD